MSSQKDGFADLRDLEDYHLVDKAQDVRGRPLVTATGEKLGVIARMLVDKREERVAALVLEDGRTFPVEEVEVRGGKAVIAAAPAPVNPPPRTGGAKEVRVPIVEEEVAIGKRETPMGVIRVRSRVEEKPVHEEITLREQHVEVERRPVNQPIDNPDALLQEQSYEFRETAEEAVVGKRAVVKEEVVVNTVAEEHVEQVDDTIRRTKVDVERQPARPDKT
jgi:stress response protein YsnF